MKHLPRRVSGFLTALMLSAFTSAASGTMPAESWVSEFNSAEAVKEAVEEAPADKIEGLWRATADGTRVAVVRGNPPGMSRGLSDVTLLLVLVKSPRPAVVPGTVMGWCTPAAKSGYYDCTMFTACNGPVLSKPARFTLHLTDGSHLSATVVRDGVEFVAWKLLPYMFRSMLRERHDRPRDLDGMLREWPVDVDNPLSPRYL